MERAVEGGGAGGCLADAGEPVTSRSVRCRRFMASRTLSPLTGWLTVTGCLPSLRGRARGR